MKKLFWIPLFVILTLIPMIAGAAPVAGEPVAGNAGSPTATNAPKYALKDAGAGDEKAALASYVKGAYNAVIKGINNTQDEIDTLNSGIETYSDAIGHLTDGKATQSGTVATIKNATTTESIATSSVNFTGVTTTSISATASGNVNLIVPIMDDWENDSLAENPVQTTASFTNLPVENLAMSAPTSNTATLTKTGITGNVDVSEYTASAYTRLEYLESTGTQYIDTGVKTSYGLVVTTTFSTKKSNVCLFGGRVSSDGEGITWGYINNNTAFNMYGSNNGSSALTKDILDNQQHTVVLSPTSLTLDGVEQAHQTFNEQVGFNDIYLFTWNNNGSADRRRWQGNVYEFSIADANGNMVRNMIPVRRNSDNVLGMYDTVSGKFFTNAGTGTFVAGPELQ